MKQIMVLNDGETFTNLDGCKIVSVPDNFDTEQIEEALANLSVNGRYIDPIVDQNIGAMTLVGDRTKDQLVAANSVTVTASFKEY